MINYRFLIISILLLLNVQILFSQEFKSGLILPKSTEDWYSEKYCCIISPDRGFSIFNKPKGKKIGNLKRKNSSNEQSKYQIFISLNTSADQPFENYREIGYEIFAINFIASKDGFLKLNDKTDLWLSQSEIEKQNFKPISWKDFLLKQNEKVLGFNANEPGLNVRKGPNSDSEVIGSCRGDLFEIKLTKEFSGNWGKVKITKYKEHPCQTDLEEKENIELKYEGWVKIIDDNGEPNIWSYNKGC